MEKRSEVVSLGVGEGAITVTAGDEDGADDELGALEEETRSTLMSTF